LGGRGPAGSSGGNPIFNTPSSKTETYGKAYQKSWVIVGRLAANGFHLPFNESIDNRTGRGDE
jgi:hypothetical protein